MDIRNRARVGTKVSYGAKYGALLQAIVDEADAIAMKYFRGGKLGAEKKNDGTVVTFTAKHGNETSTVDAPIKQDVARARILGAPPKPN